MRAPRAHKTSREDIIGTSRLELVQPFSIGSLKLVCLNKQINRESAEYARALPCPRCGENSFDAGICRVSPGMRERVSSHPRARCGENKRIPKPPPRQRRWRWPAETGIKWRAVAHALAGITDAPEARKHGCDKCVNNRPSIPNPLNWVSMIKRQRHRESLN